MTEKAQWRGDSGGLEGPRGVPGRCLAIAPTRVHVPEGVHRSLEDPQDTPGYPRIPQEARVLGLLALLAAGGLSGCDAARSAPVAIFRPESPQASAIHDLSIILLIIAGIAFALVEVWLFAAIFRYRNRPEEMAVQSHGDLRLETGWTAATAFVVFVVLGLTVKTMADVTVSSSPQPISSVPMASAFPGDTELMRIVGRQWWWIMEYPQLNVVSANEIAVPVGRTVKVQVTSQDVIHAVWIPQLGPKIDTIPGHENWISFLATRPGVYHGICAEFCGAQHARMGFRVIAMEAADFSNWVKAQQAPASPPAGGPAKEGEEIFGRQCAICHTVRGTQAQGTLGPDLTHFGSRQSLAADTLENTPENLARWLRDPQEVKPDNKMPKLGLDQAALDRLVAYLQGLK